MYSAILYHGLEQSVIVHKKYIADWIACVGTDDEL